MLLIHQLELSEVFRVGMNSFGTLRDELKCFAEVPPSAQHEIGKHNTR